MHPIDRTHGRGLAAYRLPLDSGIYPPERSDLPEGQQSKELSWSEAVEISKGSFEEIEQRREDLAEREALSRDALAPDEDRVGLGHCFTDDQLAARDARVRAAVAEDLRPLIKALAGVYDTWEQAATYEPSGNLIEEGIASLLTIEDAHAMDAATDAVLPHLVSLRRLLAETPAAPAERSVGSPTPEVGTPDHREARDAN